MAFLGDPCPVFACEEPLPALLRCATEFGCEGLDRVALVGAGFGLEVLAERWALSCPEFGRALLTCAAFGRAEFAA